MHSVETEPKPIEVFQSVSRLILEGRIPGLTPRGFGEGVHCIQYFQNSTKIHTCTPDNRMCVRDRSLRKHLQLLYDNGVPLVIEVLLGSDCNCAGEKCTSSEISPLPDPSYILLEQWTISSALQQKQTSIGNLGSSSPSSTSSPVSGPRGGNSLLQVVRSHLHFSQLAAWLSLSKGEKPKNVIYRVTMPGEDFGTKFPVSVKITEHEFPTTLVKDCAIKVQVKSLPRSEFVPVAQCSSPRCSPPLFDGIGLGKISPIIFDSVEILGDEPNKQKSDKYEKDDDDEEIDIEIRSQSQNTRKSASPVDWVNDEPIQQKISKIQQHNSNTCRIPGKHNCENVKEVQATPFRTQISPQFKHVSRRELFLRTKKLSETITSTSAYFHHDVPQSLEVEPDDSSLDFDTTMETNNEPEIFNFNPNLTTSTDDEAEADDDDRSPSNSLILSSTSSSRSTSSSNNKPIIPSLHEKIKFRKSLHSAASMVFHGKTGLPLTSSPAPLRKGQNRFDFDSSLTSPAQISSSVKKFGHHAQRLSETSQLLGSFEESVLRGRIEPVSTIEGFSAEIGASGSFCPQHLHLPVTVFFYTFCDNDKVSTPYLAHINVGKKGYAIPKKGTLQVTLFNPLRTVIKMFVVMYDFSDMPPNSRTFLRQRILYMPIGSDDKNEDAQKWLRYLIHLRFASSRSGKIYLHTDLRIIIFRKSDADTAMGHTSPIPHELRSFTYAPENPKYSPRMSSSSGGGSSSGISGKREKGAKKMRSSSGGCACSPIRHSMSKLDLMDEFPASILQRIPVTV